MHKCIFGISIHFFNWPIPNQQVCTKFISSSYSYPNGTLTYYILLMIFKTAMVIMMTIMAPKIDICIYGDGCYSYDYYIHIQFGNRSSF